VGEDKDIQVSFEKMLNTHMKPMPTRFQKSCFDISAGGVSFFVSRTEAKAFEAKDVIKLMEVKAGSWSGKVEAEVISITEVEPNEYNGLSYKAWRVACRFSSIDQVSRKYLEKFIFERIKDELHVING
jgi:c-di-GMP-binding flagellar brake protein YcgR